ncbi:hypothetical protein POL68_20690 [Stigmatella sp. ncwal1]|uniref:Uncharacterized protein n=1 Tax=Stigmatella ashevillensis TaxID=2995309 RepID=A0ABT5DB79_9BACT|nr:hypothetical protein [Stigmatella ashevillena]MDC0710903.1 hypothetical protein [Stigmatella ashevillena]
MALPPHEYARAALDAELHVQVTVDRVELPPATPGEAVVTGHIARVFRGSPSLCSTPVSFSVPVCREDDVMAPCGTIWTLPEMLKQAPVMEVFLDSHEGGFRNASYDNHLLEALTDAPMRVYTEEMAREPVQRRTAGRYDPREERRELLLYGALSIIGLAVFCWALVRWSS